MVAYYGGLRTNELRAIEFGKIFPDGGSSFEVDSHGYWIKFERSKQRGLTETTTICVPRRQADWVPVVGDTFRCPVDYDPASTIDEYLELLESDLKLTREELTGPLFRSTHGVGGLTFLKSPLGVNYLGKIGVEFAMQLLLPNSAGYTGHCWRRSCGTNASNAGVNVTTLMAQLGWSTPKTALGYVAKSKITSLTMSTFLSNIQRQNKVIDAGGVRSTPQGVQLLKSDICPRSAKKKLSTGEEVSQVAGRALNDPTCDRIVSELEMEEEYLKACEDSASGSTQAFMPKVSASKVSSSKVSSSKVSSVASSLGSAPVVSANSSSTSDSTLPPCTELVSVSASDSVVNDLNSGAPSDGALLQMNDPRVSAILQNFQNNGNVQIHFHFSGKN